MTFGQIMKVRRTVAGLTQEQLARRCGVRQGTISKYENDEIIPGLREGVVIMKRLKIRVSEVLELLPKQNTGGVNE